MLSPESSPVCVQFIHVTCSVRQSSCDVVVAGTPGDTGFTGPRGNVGTPGQAGAAGPTGFTGLQGFTGGTGASGKFVCLQLSVILCLFLFSCHLTLTSVQLFEIVDNHNIGR